MDEEEGEVGEEEVGEDVAENVVPVSLACRPWWQVDIDKGGFLDFEVENSPSRDGLHIIHFQGIVD